jgi:hypothetical protein
METEQITDPKDQIISQLIIDLKNAREHLTIEDYAHMMGCVFDDPELEQLRKAIDNIRII